MMARGFKQGVQGSPCVCPGIKHVGVRAAWPKVLVAGIMESPYETEQFWCPGESRFEPQPCGHGPFGRFPSRAGQVF